MALRLRTVPVSKHTFDRTARAAGHRVAMAAGREIEAIEQQEPRVVVGRDHKGARSCQHEAEPRQVVAEQNLAGDPL